MNKLYYGDNFDILRNHIEDNSVDLIYIDPPFNSKRNYNIIYDGASAQAEVFKDTWSLRSWQDEKRLIFFDEAQRYSGIHNIIDALEKLLINSNPSLFGYLVNMAIRIVELHRVLKDTGSFYLHCDPVVSHYLKIILDEIFSSKNFKNEIVWGYDTGGRAKTKFPSKHDIIFWYVITDKYKFEYDQVALPRDFSTMHEKVEIDEEGRPYQTNIKYGKLYKYYLDKGVLPNDWWSDIQALNPSAKERVGYPTQKPEALLERIINAGSNEGDVVLDAFCGCGTTVAVAQRLKRKWVGIDITFLSIDLIRQRLLDEFYRNTLGLNEIEARDRFNEDVTIFGIPRDLEGAKQLARQTKGDRVRKEFEKWAIFSVGGVYFEKKGADTGIDGYFYIQDVDENRKLKKLKCLIQVKSGKVGVRDIRDFSHTLNREDSPIGIFITLENPTKPMLDEIGKMLQYTTQLGKTLQRIYIVTIQDIIDDKLPDLPIQRATKRAQRAKVKINQNTIF